MAKQIKLQKHYKNQKKITRTVPSGVAHVKATFNNTIVTITDPSGNVISWASAGKTNFTGSRKSSAFAASVAAQDAGKIAMHHGMKEVEVSLKGPGSGRESAVRELQSAGLIITMIKDKNPSHIMDVVQEKDDAYKEK